MLVTFKNTGMIEKADIRLDGLTVIAGENNTGKSTVGKMMYSIIKTFNRYEKDARLFQVSQIKNAIDDLYFNFKKEYNGAPGLIDMKEFFDGLENEALALLEKSLANKEIEFILAEKIKGFTEIIKSISGKEPNLGGIPGRIAAVIDKKPPRDTIYKDSFEKYIKSVLSGEVSNKFSKDPAYSITGTDGDNKIFEISGRNGNLKIDVEDRFYFEDATFIESPVILNLVDSLRFSMTEFDGNGDIKKQVELLEKAYAPEYMKDLILKLTKRNTRGDQAKIVEKIRDIIDGYFYYDPEERDFVFEAGNQTFKGVAIASGIKFLGIVNILFLAGFLGKKTLLIIDEPETHMHPQWQLDFAEVLVKLVKEGSHILLTSHSPYLIEALKLYADDILGKNQADFYWSKREKNAFVSCFYHVTHDLSPVYNTLAGPFRKLDRIKAKKLFS